MPKAKTRKKEVLTGGLADNRPDSDFDPEQLRAGMATEKEHTSDPEKQKEIAKDHLTEDPQYYIKLKKIEKAARLPVENGLHPGTIVLLPDGRFAVAVTPQRMKAASGLTKAEGAVSKVWKFVVPGVNGQREFVTESKWEEPPEFTGGNVGVVLKAAQREVLRQKVGRTRPAPRILAEEKAGPVRRIVDFTRSLLKADDGAGGTKKKIEGRIVKAGTISATVGGRAVQFRVAGINLGDGLLKAEPTEAQKEAGNYKKDHVSVQGLSIAIENPKGSYRSGTDADGSSWRTKMHCDYGYIKRTEGADGDHVDVFIGPDKESEIVFVVDQVKPKTGEFDEHKVMMGFSNEAEARKGYLENYESGWKGLGTISPMTMGQFKVWLQQGQTGMPVAYDGEGKEFLRASIGDRLFSFLKARKGEIKAGAKYFRREPKSGGGYRYYYTEESWRKEHPAEEKKEEPETKPEQPKTGEGESIGNGLFLRLYKNAVLVVGDTFKNIEYLREFKSLTGLGAFNKKLNGWVFPVSRKDELKEFFLNKSTEPSEELSPGQPDVTSTSEETEKAGSEEVGLDKQTEKKTGPGKKPPSETDPSADKWSSENYRYKDTGYIPGSRKEQAASVVRKMAREKRQVLPSDIDWENLEQNPREAEEIIKKSNLFGEVDWEKLRSEGMDPGAGFLVDRIYAAIPTTPGENTPEDRFYYAMALQTLRDRMEKTKTAGDITGVIKEIYDELNGYLLTDAEVIAIDKLKAQARKLNEGKVAYDSTVDKARREFDTARIEFYRLEREVENRKRRNWKPDPELNQKFEQARATMEEKDRLYEKAIYSNPEYHHPKGFKDVIETRMPDNSTKFERVKTPHEEKMSALNNQRYVIQNGARERHEKSDVYKTWKSFGNKFLSILNYRSRYSGSKTFRDHVASVGAGRVKDWNWLEKSARGPKKASQREKAFQLIVTESFTRKGGRSIKSNSTTHLKNTFGLRDIQSGNWVLKDPQSAAFHVQKSAEAFSDLADILGIKDSEVSLNGELALAFGARGHGNAGWKGAAPAHYETKDRVINLTKMGGGGSLGHEWFHAIDNLIGSLEKSRTGRKSEPDWRSMGSEDTSAIEHAGVRAAFDNLIQTMHDGQFEEATSYEYSGRDYQLAKANVNDRINYGIGAEIRNAGDLNTALNIIRERNSQFKNVDTKDQVKKLDKYDRKRYRNYQSWIKIALAHYGGEEGGGIVQAKTGRKISSFMREAQRLSPSSYWASKPELGARAFAAYLEDRLKEKGRQSDYLASGSDNVLYRMSGAKPFPEGEERKRINGAFDQLFTAIKDAGLLTRIAEVMKARRLEKERMERQFSFGGKTVMMKARPHKYIRKEGSGPTARYFYLDSQGKEYEGDASGNKIGGGAAQQPSSGAQKQPAQKPETQPTKDKGKETGKGKEKPAAPVDKEKRKKVVGIMKNALKTVFETMMEAYKGGQAEDKAAAGVQQTGSELKSGARTTSQEQKPNQPQDQTKKPAEPKQSGQQEREAPIRKKPNVAAKK